STGSSHAAGGSLVAPASSVRIALAPAVRASVTNSAPCTRLPGNAAKRSPVTTSCARRLTPVTVVERSAASSCNRACARADSVLTGTGSTRSGRSGAVGPPSPAASVLLTVTHGRLPSGSIQPDGGYHGVPPVSSAV